MDYFPIGKRLFLSCSANEIPCGRAPCHQQTEVGSPAAGEHSSPGPAPAQVMHATSPTTWWATKGEAQAGR